MNMLRGTLAAMLLIAGGIIVYDLAVREALIGETLPLLLLLTLQVLLGGVVGELMRSWRAVAIGPLAFIAGFLAAAPLQSTGPIPSVPATDASTAISALAGGSLVLGTIFVLALLACLLAVGIAIGATRGIRLQRRTTAHRSHRSHRSHRPHLLPLAEVMADLDHIEQFVTPDTHASTPAHRDVHREPVHV
jgi:hypothetical protein